MPTSQENRARLRAMTHGAYDLQKLRIQAGLRLCANFRAKLGLTNEPGGGDGDDEDTAGDTEAQRKAAADRKAAEKVVAVLKSSFARLTDGIAKNRTLPAREGFKGDKIISDYTELVIVSQYLELERVERQQFVRLEEILSEIPIYTEFLSKVRGVGPAMAAVIVSEFDIHIARYPSSLWAYAGLDVGENGAGRSRKREHLVKREYTTRDGEVKERDSITYNPFLKSKLVGVLAGSFLRTGSEYAKVYKDYRHRLETNPGREDWRKGRYHRAALRYMVKVFLVDLYKAWRPLEGLEVKPSYAEAKLGLHHRQDAA